MLSPYEQVFNIVCLLEFECGISLSADKFPYALSIKWYFSGFIWLSSDANKSVFDWCKDGNVKKMDVLLTRGENINTKDDQVL